MAILKKAEFEKEIREAIEKQTGLPCYVIAKKQWFCSDYACGTTVRMELEIEINGLVEDIPTYVDDRLKFKNRKDAQNAITAAWEAFGKTLEKKAEEIIEGSQ